MIIFLSIVVALLVINQIRLSIKIKNKFGVQPFDLIHSESKLNGKIGEIVGKFKENEKKIDSKLELLENRLEAVAVFNKAKFETKKTVQSKYNRFMGISFMSLLGMDASEKNKRTEECANGDSIVYEEVLVPNVVEKKSKKKSK